MDLSLSDHLHEHQPILSAGAPLDAARSSVIMVHGRGASAADILTLVDEINLPQVAYLAPQAAGHSWYPFRFLESTSRNEPWLTSALRLVNQAVEQAHRAGLKDDEIILLGFSQGACLALEYAARNGRRWGGVVGFSGALIGAENEPRTVRGNLDGTPIFLGCSDVDFHIPLHRVQDSADVLQEMGGKITFRVYPGMGHTINRDELLWVRGLLEKLNT